MYDEAETIIGVTCDVFQSRVAWVGKGGGGQAQGKGGLFFCESWLIYPWKVRTWTKLQTPPNYVKEDLFEGKFFLLKHDFLTIIVMRPVTRFFKKKKKNLSSKQDTGYLHIM